MMSSCKISLKLPVATCAVSRGNLADEGSVEESRTERWGIWILEPLNLAMPETWSLDFFYFNWLVVFLLLAIKRILTNISSCHLNYKEQVRFKKKWRRWGGASFLRICTDWDRKPFQVWGSRRMQWACILHLLYCSLYLIYFLLTGICLSSPPLFMNQ